MVKLRLLAVIAAIAVLSGCTSAQAPVSASERAHIRTVLLDEQWAPLAASYPEAFRPRIPVTHTVPDHDWAPTGVACLRGRGYDALAVGAGLQYSAKSN